MRHCSHLGTARTTSIIFTAQIQGHFLLPAKVNGNNSRPVLLRSRKIVMMSRRIKAHLSSYKNKTKLFSLLNSEASVSSLQPFISVCSGIELCSTYTIYDTFWDATCLFYVLSTSSIVLTWLNYLAFCIPECCVS